MCVEDGRATRPVDHRFRAAGRWDTVAAVMRMLQQRVPRVVVTLAVLFAVGWTADAAAFAPSAAGDREHQRVVASLALGIDDAALHNPRPGLRNLFRRGGQGSWRASAAAGAAAALLVGAAPRGGRRARLAARRRHRLPSWRGSRAPPALQPA